MAPRRGPATGLRAVTTTLTAAAFLVSLLLSSCHISDAAVASPTPSTSVATSPAPALPHQQTTPATIPGAAPPTPPPPPERHRRAPSPRGAQSSAGSSQSWHRQLNLGQMVGLALVAAAVAMQVAFVAYLAVRARQMRRAGNAEAEWSPRPAWQVRASPA